MNIPPAMRDEDEHEILHLSKRMKLEEDIYDREVSYLSDHQVYHRFAKNGNWGTGWTYWKVWQSLDEIYRVLDKKKEKGWKITLHPSYVRGMCEFSKVVTF